MIAQRLGMAMAGTARAARPRNWQLPNGALLVNAGTQRRREGRGCDFIGTAELAHRMLEIIAISKPVMNCPKKILLVDREPGVTRLVRRALEKTGKYWIKEEHDSQFALHSAKWFQPDLILLDTVTASPDREVLAREIKTDAALRETPVMCLNNLKPESQMISGGILSGYSFFSAPIKIDEVLRGVEQVLFGKD